MVKYLGKTEHDLDLVTKSYLVQKISNLTDDSALASALSSYIKNSDANNLVSELRSEVEEKLQAKVVKVDGKTLSTNDFTNEFRQKLENLYTHEQIEQKIRESVKNIDLSQYITQTIADGKYARVDHQHNEYLTSIPNDVVRKSSDNQIELTIDPKNENHLTRKGYVDRKISEIDMSIYARADHTHTNFDNLSIGNKLSFGDFGIQFSGGEYPSLTINHSESGNIMTARQYFVDFWKNFDIHGNFIKGLPTPTADDHAASKAYVDTKVGDIEIPEVDLSKYATKEQMSEAIGGIDFGEYLTNIPDDVVRTDVMQTYVSEQINAIPDVDLSGYIKESNADSRYAPVNHTHSQYLTSIPDDLARKQYVDDAVEAKADSKLVQQLQTKIEELEQKVQTLESRSGKVKNINSNRWLDVGIYPNGQLPSNSTNRLLFEEE